MDGKSFYLIMLYIVYILMIGSFIYIISTANKINWDYGAYAGISAIIINIMSKLYKIHYGDKNEKRRKRN